MAAPLLLTILLLVTTTAAATTTPSPEGCEECESCMTMDGHDFHLKAKNEPLCNNGCMYVNETGDGSELCWCTSDTVPSSTSSLGQWTRDFAWTCSSPKPTTQTAIPATTGPTGLSPPQATPSPVTTTAPAPATASPYCALSSQHTMCLFTGPSATCAAKTRLRGLEQAAKDAILARHNHFRRIVASMQSSQPPASNMRELVWDDELERIAQRWADQCIYDHEEAQNSCTTNCRTKLDGTGVGQNLYISANTAESDQAALTAAFTAEATSPVKAWYDEVTDPGFNNANIDPFQFDLGTGHYTQLVWAATYQIGCANVYYPPGPGGVFSGPFFENLLICNYAVAGNLVQGSMYLQGPACSACPAGTTCIDSLCRADAPQ